MSIILPVRNQEQEINANFPKIFEYIKKYSAEVIIVESGSTDGSVRSIRNLSKRYKFRFMQTDALGKGMALRTGIIAAQGDIIGYLDTDLAVPLKYIPGAVAKISAGCDIVIGNRYKKTSHAKRKLGRYIESKAYIYLIRLLYRSRITDFQCGFKFFRADFLKANLNKVEDNRWFFDTKLVLLAEKQGRRICQLPVEFADTERSTVSSKDVFYFIKQTFTDRFT